MAHRAERLDVRDGDGLPSPGVVDEQFRVDAEDPVQKVLRRVRDVPHGVDAVVREPPHGPAADAPEVGEGEVVPEEPPVPRLVQGADEVRGRLGHDVQRDLAQVQVRPDAAGGPDAGRVVDVLHDAQPQFFRVHVVHVQIVGDVEERLVHRVHMDVLFGDVLEVHPIDARRVLEVQVHAGDRGDVVDVFRDLEDPAPVLDAQRLHGRGDGETDGLVRPLRVGDGEERGHGVQPPFHALDRRVKRLEVDA